MTVFVAAEFKSLLARDLTSLFSSSLDFCRLNFSLFCNNKSVAESQ